jgi:uncharacterized protein (TIGR01244 family)
MTEVSSPVEGEGGAMPCREIMKTSTRTRLARAATMVAALTLAVTGPGCRTAAVRPAPSVPETVEPSLLPNYTRLHSDLAAAGQPTEAGLQRLREMGFRVVIDLRAPSEGTAAEEAAVKAAGLRYVSVPVTPETFRREDVDAVARVLDERGRGPVLLHCSSSNRVGGVWAVLQSTKGLTYEEAEAEGRKAGLRSAGMITAVKRVVRPQAEGH